MNKNLVLKFAYAISVVLLCTTEVAFAVEKSPELKFAIKTLLTKYSLAMLGIVFFMVLITIGLTIYNKFFVASQVKDYKLSKDSLRSPSDNDEAVLMFISKNRLK